jgi:CBS domain-containing protein
VKTIGQLLNVKGHDVWTITPDATVYDALKLMAEKEVGALVVAEAGRVVGIISERDYARKVILKGKFSKDTLVSEIMTPRVIAVHLEQAIEECMALMTDKHIRHLPVIENDQLVGIVSIGDLVKAIISEQEFLIDNLQAYIVGSREVR